MSKAMLVAASVAALALASSAVAEPFGAGRSREGSVEPRGAERRHDFWEGRDRLAERHRRRPATQGPPPGQSAAGYPGQTPYPYGGYDYGASYGYGYGGYSGAYGDTPPRPAPPHSPRGLHDGLWYY